MDARPDIQRSRKPSRVPSIKAQTAVIRIKMFHAKFKIIKKKAEPRFDTNYVGIYYLLPGKVKEGNGTLLVDIDPFTGRLRGRA